MTVPEPILMVRGVSKQFGRTQALLDVDLEVRAGEIVGLLGENGAGKSTLIKILSGATRPDAGSIYIATKRHVFDDPVAARRAGVATVFQELSLAPHLTVSENLFLGRLGRGFSCVSRKALSARATHLLHELGWEIEVGARVESLETSEQQLVEIARAIASDARVLLLDEPTSSLAPKEADEFASKVRALAQNGMAIVYVSHHLDEAFSLVDTFAVLRDGNMVLREEKKKIDRGRIVRAMLGRAVQLDAVKKAAKTRHDNEPPALMLRSLTDGRTFHNVSLCAYSGEVVGLTGLMGCGSEQLIQSLFSGRFLRGEVAWSGRTGVLAPDDLVRSAVGYVPPHRSMAIFPDLSVKENVTLTARVAKAHTKETVESVVNRLAIRMPGLDHPVRSLSGGNQQKVVFARWLLLHPKILFLVEPTRGVDIGVRKDIHVLIRQLVTKGMAILLVSSDLEEVSRVSDRVFVMHEGAIKKELATPSVQDLHEAIVEAANE